MSYIDGELPVNLVSSFLAHADKCLVCKKALNELLFLKKSLSGMRRANASPDFSFRVINAIRKEQRLMKNPLYLFRIFLRENYQKFVFVPVVGIILFGWITFNETGVNSKIAVSLKNIIAEVMQQDDSQPMNELGVEKVNYILESVSPMDVEKGIMVEYPYVSNGQISNSQLTLVNF